ncbi:spermatogenesis-associated serine-rich protein 1 isoform X1 [Triplophysa dalaica]|uniref:spermatogenesis-associated serine-rich protein 1 isoform X1 n=1 Tax=Triplophysa dalaica TaxID=1582913 RepID=UPI0024DF33BF|nr:spermatogenesis-associated serine-rich protein 1 isoform X1 [Triplophysa dalaica]XP_056621099.1 spermatogenesis-associated serine-rich protein 1 isoform X1 [Triplophysa dalaica]XP_056621100.1 spermatogenesis-associated serine-rich protein 1 isoform X1 [Triplophysa dalaica]
MSMNMWKHTASQHSLWSSGKEQEFKPHIRHVEPVLTECDLDWKSRLRWIAEPRYGDAPLPHIKDIKFPIERKLMRSFPQSNMTSWTEWSFYPNFGQPKIYHTGKRCFIDNMNHPRSTRCISENSLESSIGRKKKSFFLLAKDKFNSSTRARPFLVPEYSPGFHKFKSTPNTITFGSITTCGSYIHIQAPPKEFRKSYAEKNKIREKENDILEVERLNNWKPAPDVYSRAVLQEI